MFKNKDNQFNIEQLDIGKADNSTLKTQNSTMPKALPPAWFRTTGPSLFNHTCFNHYSYFISIR